MQQAFSLQMVVHAYPGRCPGLVYEEPVGLWDEDVGCCELAYCKDGYS